MIAEDNRHSRLPARGRTWRSFCSCEWTFLVFTQLACYGGPVVCVNACFKMCVVGFHVISAFIKSITHEVASKSRLMTRGIKKHKQSASNSYSDTQVRAIIHRLSWYALLWPSQVPLNKTRWYVSVYYLASVTLQQNFFTSLIVSHIKHNIT
jgi:hypothetical protein